LQQLTCPRYFFFGATCRVGCKTVTHRARQNVQNAAVDDPSQPSQIWAKSTLGLQGLHFKHVALSRFDKKIVVKRPGFSYFHCQLHRMVPG
jgi:hypothetical protein